MESLYTQHEFSVCWARNWTKTRSEIELSLKMLKNTFYILKPCRHILCNYFYRSKGTYFEHVRLHVQCIIVIKKISYISLSLECQVSGVTCKSVSFVSYCRIYIFLILFFKYCPHPPEM